MFNLTDPDRRPTISAFADHRGVISYSDYYPFGWVMPGREGSSENYRYGFNGMERDDETTVDGGSLDFGARIYDSRVGRWLSVDPEFKMYPQFSPYNYALNVPTNIIDPDGGVATDEDGNVIFVPAGKPEWIWQGKITKSFDPKTGEITQSGMGYTSQRGFIMTDDGTKVEVYLVSDKSVHRATRSVVMKDNGIPSFGPIQKEEKIEKYNATTNCTGDCFVKGTVVLSSDKVTDKFLSHEGFDIVDGDPLEGDIGLYYLNGIVQHAESYENRDMVSSKGGVKKKEFSKPARTTWDGEQDNYRVVRKTGENTIVDGANEKGSAENGVRTVSKSEFKSIQKQVKSKKKE